MKLFNFSLSSIFCLSIVTVLFVGCQPAQQKPYYSEEEQPAADTVQSQSAVPAEPEVRIGEKKEVSHEKSLIQVTKAAHDLKEVGPKSVSVVSYTFKNAGNRTLKVERIQSTCGCSRPTLIKDGKRYPMPLKEPVAFEPEESGEVEVTFTAPASKGTVIKHLYIVSDDPKTPRAELEIKAEVVVKVEASPESVDLRLDQENAGMPDIVVKSLDNQEFSIKSVSIARGVINIPFDKTQKATMYTLKPVVDLQKLSEFTTGVIQIETDHPQSGTLLVRYNAKPQYEVRNARYILQNIEPGVAVTRDNVIVSNYGSPVEIASFSTRNGYMDIESQEQDGEHLKLVIKITPPDNETSKRYITDELTIILKDGAELKIRCSGWFRIK